MLSVISITVCQIVGGCQTPTVGSFLIKVGEVFGMVVPVVGKYIKTHAAEHIFHILFIVSGENTG